MPIRDQFVAAMPFIAGIGIPIGVLLSGTALPIAYDLKGSVGELKSSAASIQRQLDAQDVQLVSSATTSFRADASRRSSLPSSEAAARAVSPASRFLPASRKSFDQR